MKHVTATESTHKELKKLAAESNCTISEAIEILLQRASWARVAHDLLVEAEAAMPINSEIRKKTNATIRITPFV